MSTTEEDIILPDTVDMSEIDTTQPDTHQFDLWVPNPEFHDKLSTSQLLLGLDAIDVNQLRGLQFFWAAGYVGGHWPTFHPICLAYPSLAKAGRVKSYAVNYLEDADWLDCEAGDATVAQANPWIQRQFARGHKMPGVYANLSRWLNEGLKDDLAHWGDQIVRIVAWFNGVANLDSIPWANIKQFTDSYAGRNLDGNVAQSNVFVSGPPVVNRVHYEWFYTGPFPTKRWGNLNERLVVEEYDGARLHMDKYKDYIANVLEPGLRWLANRVANVAINIQPNKDHSPSWQVDSRGWRFQQLIHRAQGMQFVK